MKFQFTFAACCWRFKESVKEGILVRSKNYDETEWFIDGGDHIYYCPYCGSYIKGKGFGRSPKKANKITSQEYTLLREIIFKYKPDLVNLVDTLGVNTLTVEQRENIRLVLADELSNNGLKEEFEPNEYGLKIENIIDKLLYYSE